MTGVTFMVVQWFKFCTPNSQGTGSTPGWGTKILYAAQHCRKKKKENTGKLYYLTKNNRK